MLARTAASGATTTTGALAEQAVELFSHFDWVGVAEGEQLGGPQVAGKIPLAGDQAVDFTQNCGLTRNGQGVLGNVDGDPKFDFRTKGTPVHPRSGDVVPTGRSGLGATSRGGSG